MGRLARLQGVQVPSWDARLFDLAKAAESKTYCDEIAGIARANGVQITELGTHLQGQLVAVHPAYDDAFDAFAPDAVKGKPAERQRWAVEQMLLSARASRHLGLTSNVSFPGALAWPYLYPWPQRPAGLIEAAFDELAKRWRPIFDAFDDVGCHVCFELHPGEDLFDGVTFEMFLERVDNHPRCCINYDPSHFVLQQLDYLEFIDIYHSAHQGAAHQGRRVPAQRPPGRVFGLPAVDQPRRALSLARRRAGRLQGDLLEDGAVRLRRLGGARVGVLLEASRSRGLPRVRRSFAITSSASPRRRSTTSPAAASDAKQFEADAGPLSASAAMTIEAKQLGGHAGAASASAWSAAARAPSSAPCTASRRASTTTTSSSPARSSSTPDKAQRSGLALGLAAERIYSDYAAMAEGRGGARRRHRGGGDRHPEPPARAGGRGVPEGRHPRHLRQAGDDDA